MTVGMTDRLRSRMRSKAPPRGLRIRFSNSSFKNRIIRNPTDRFRRSLRDRFRDADFDFAQVRGAFGSTARAEDTVSERIVQKPYQRIVNLKLRFRCWIPPGGGHGADAAPGPVMTSSRLFPVGPAVPTSGRPGPVTAPAARGRWNAARGGPPAAGSASSAGARTIRPRPAPPLPLPGAARLAAAVCLALNLAACASADRTATGSITPAGVAGRTPLVLTDRPRTFDVAVTGTGRIDPRRAGGVDAFLTAYRHHGRGVLVVAVPSGSRVPGPAVARTTESVRAHAAGRGVSPREIVVAPYPVDDAAVAAPVRLSFQPVQAEAAEGCGMRIRDPGAAAAGFDGGREAHGRPGCITRATRIDALARTGDPRPGKDPSTTWTQDGRVSVMSQVAR
ncbi:MAG: CpaD family pilus assembly lipoprotein [Methylobacterium frigidaeris]